MSATFGLKAGNSLTGLSANSFVDFVDSLPPQLANTGTTGAWSQHFDAIARTVKGTATGQGTNGSYVRVRASAGGAILITGTVGVGATSATVINQGAGTAAQFAAQLELWFNVTGNFNILGIVSAADTGDDVDVTFPTGASYQNYVFETDDPALAFYETTPQSVRGAGSLDCNQEGLTYDGQVNGKSSWVFAGASDPSSDGIQWTSTQWVISRGTLSCYESLDDTDIPSQAVFIVGGDGIAPAPTVVGASDASNAAMAVTWNNGAAEYWANAVMFDDDNPTVTEQVNSLGASVAITRSGEGRYAVTASSAVFTSAAKCNVQITAGLPSGPTTDGMIAGWDWISTTVVQFRTYSILGIEADAISNGGDAPWSIRITVFP